MTDTAFKYVSLQGKTLDAPNQPSVKNVAGGTVMAGVATSMVSRAQDTIPATARSIVGLVHVSGEETWAIDSATDPDAAGQYYPEVSTWRAVASSFSTVLTPGCFLEAHVVAAPCGMAEEQDAALNWVGAGATGVVRVSVTWTGRSTSSATTHSIVLPGSKGTYGAEPSGAGSDWVAMFERVIPEIRPANVDTTPATLEEYSHDCVALITVDVQGGVRPHSIIIYEVPYAHAQDHNTSTVEAVHAYTVGQTVAKQQDHTDEPRQEAADGATYQENRFGTDQILRAAHYQSRKLGPHLLSWTSWQSDPTVQTSATQSPLTTSAPGSWVDIFDNALTSWDIDNPGWIVSCPYAQIAEWCGSELIMDGRACVVPVKIVAVVTWTDQSGSAGADFKFQSSDVSFHTINTTSATADRVTAYGFLEGQVYGDQFIATLQVFTQATDGGDTNIYAISIRAFNPDR